MIIDFFELPWETKAPNVHVTIKEIDHFDARGMKCVFGRGDHFARHLVFRMDIWISVKGILFMRCWSHCYDIDWRSFEIRGLDAKSIPKRKSRSEAFSDAWIPKAVRDEYSKWITEEF